MTQESTIKIGDKVKKITGDYKFEGTIVAEFAKIDGKIRYVAENSDGILHIYSAKNLAKI